MDILELRRYCLSLPLAEECTPFDETTLVFKIGGKMFCYTDMVEFRWIAVKCDPDRAVLLRERYPELVTPAFHSNKRHWNGIRTDGDLPDAFIREQLRHSYLLVAAGITPKPCGRKYETRSKSRAPRRVTRLSPLSRISPASAAASSDASGNTRPATSSGKSCRAMR